MDISQLTPAIVTLLVPHLPALWHAGEKIVDGALEKVGEHILEDTVQLWHRLRGKAEERPELKGALADLAQTPQDPDLQAALRVQLRKLLESDPALTRELETLLQAGGRTVIKQKVIGKGNIVSAGDQHIGNITQNFN